MFDETGIRKVRMNAAALALAMACWVVPAMRAQASRALVSVVVLEPRIVSGGEVLRTWATEMFLRPGSGPEDLPQPEIVPLNDVPGAICARCRCLAQDTSHLFFVETTFLCYEPASDKWYGDFVTEPWSAGTRATSGQGGIWFSTNLGLFYLDTAEFIDAARKAGRVMTSEQFRKKRDAFFAAAGPLEQAKAAAVLDKDPANAEALLLMGLLHESGCLNDFDKAMAYYARLVEIRSDSPAALAGLTHQYRMNIAGKRYAEALRIGETIERRFPHNVMGQTLGRYNRWLRGKIKGKTR